jgi:hypothetical protein
MSSMENRPEPLHLHAVQQEGVPTVRVMRGTETIVVSSSRDFVADTIRELKLRGHDHETHVVIYGVSHNAAWNGSIKQHGA